MQLWTILINASVLHSETNGRRVRKGQITLEAVAGCNYARWKLTTITTTIITIPPSMLSWLQKC